MQKQDSNKIRVAEERTSGERKYGETRNSDRKRHEVRAKKKEGGRGDGEQQRWWYSLQK